MSIGDKNDPRNCPRCGHFNGPFHECEPPDPRDKIIADLVAAMKWWANQEDGVPEDCWEAYAAGVKHTTGKAPEVVDI